MLKFTIPMKVKWTPFKKCDECGSKKISTTFYEVHDTGLNAHVDLLVCKKCMKEAKERVRKAPKCSLCEDVIDGNHKSLCESCKEDEEWEKSEYSKR